LQPWVWTRPSRFWASVTPVKLDRYPRRASEDEAIGIVSDAVERVAGVRAAAVEVGPVSQFAGAPAVREYRRIPDRDSGPPRPLVHVVVAFPTLVTGVLTLGAGRHLGLGLLRPLGR